MVCALSFMVVVSGCDVSPDKFELKVIKWGPQSADMGTVPNIQPDGNMGMWIEVADTEGLGDAQLFFADQPVVAYVYEKLITAAIPKEQLSKPGSKVVTVKQTLTGKIFPVGTFVVEAKK